MSIEIRRANRRVECDWGIIEYPRARPDRGEVGPLVLVAAAGFADLMRNGGTNMRDAPAVASATLHTDDEEPTEESVVRMFYHLDYEGRRWTWELFSAHWEDRRVLPKIYIGRWPD